MPIDHEQLEEIVKTCLDETFTRLGIAADDPLEMQADFRYLREWRTAMESAKKTSVRTAIGIVVTGLLGALFVGLRYLLNW